MAVADFSKILQKHIISRVSKAAKAKISTQGLDIGNMRKTLEAPTRHIAILSNNSIDALVSEFKDVKTGTVQILVPYSGKLKYAKYSELDPKLKKTVSSAIEKFSTLKYPELLEYIQKNASYIYDGKTRQAEIVTESSKDTFDTITRISNIPQSQLITFVLDYLKVKHKLTEDERVFLFNNLEAGHTAGMFNLKMLNTFGLLSHPSGRSISGHSKRNIPDDKVDESVKFMNGVIDMLLEADRLSSNMPNELTLFADSQKALGGRKPTASTEIQLAWTNRESGSMVQGLGTRIANLIKVASDNTKYSKERKQPEAVKSLVEGIQKLALNLKAQYALKDTDLSKAASENIDKFVLDYIKTPSSPIILNDLIEGIAETIIGKTKRTPKVHKTSTKEKVLSFTNSVSGDLKKAVQLLKDTQKKLKATKDTSKPTSFSRAIKIKPPVVDSLLNLQTLINSHLSQRIKQNMVKPALQNRTGRFAESAKVERLSESRQGMITAFYSYMKSPYQTFEPGFKQGSEKRNPKTLISKSIREVASTIVGNRLRAVRL